jgi:hypothetical protein
MHAGQSKQVQRYIAEYTASRRQQQSVSRQTSVWDRADGAEVSVQTATTAFQTKTKLSTFPMQIQRS